MARLRRDGEQARGADVWSLPRYALEGNAQARQLARGSLTRLQDPLWRQYVMQSALVRDGEMSAADAMRDLIARCERLGRPTSAVSAYLRALQAEDPGDPLAKPEPWEPDES